MRHGEFPARDQLREGINAEIVETARQGVHDFCVRMIDSAYQTVVGKLQADADELDVFAKSGFPESQEVKTFISPDILYAPMYQDIPQDTLTIVLIHDDLTEETEEERFGDRMRIYIPVGSDYVYPSPLDPETPVDEMYVEFMPGPTSGEPPARYVIQHDESDPQYRFTIFAYESAADGGEQVIYDTFSDRVMYEGLTNRISANIEITARLLRRIGNFNPVYQTRDDQPSI